MVAPSGLKKHIIAMIDGEMEKQRNGQAAGILFKLNSLTDRDILNKLSEASCTGVRVRLINRGICCILPGIPGHTETITTISIVGRYLEHIRAYCLGTGNSIQIYISSADLMTRNTERRVEIACPVFDAEIKARILDILEVQLRDNVKARRLRFEEDYECLNSENNPFCC